MKQTATEWLIEQLQAPCRGIPSHIIEQAKAMEMEQSIDFARHCLNKAKDLDILTAFMNTQQYYNETFKSE